MTARTQLRRAAAVLGLALAGGLVAAPVASAEDLPVGTATIVTASGEALEGGGSTTAFSLELSGANECQGDSADKDYRVNSYLVPDSVAPTAVQFDGLGPAPKAYGDYATFRMGLFDADTTSEFVSEQTANAEQLDDPGLILPLPAFDFDQFSEPGYLPAGRYHLGIACTRLNEITRIWDAQIEVTADPADHPAGIRWTVVGFQAPSGSGSSSVLPIFALVVLVAIAAAVLIRRRRPSARTAPSRRNP